jgi:hypothetical protein
VDKSARESRDLAARLASGGRGMEKNLTYYQQRLAEEQAAEQSAMHPAVRAAHHELARGYEEQIAALEAQSHVTGLHVVSAV